MHKWGVSVRRAVYSPLCGIKYAMMVAYVGIRLPGEFMASNTELVNLITLIIVVLLCSADFLEFKLGQKKINGRLRTPIIEADAQIVFDSLAFIAVLDWYLLSNLEEKNRNSLAYSMAFGSVFFFFIVLTVRFLARSRLAAIGTTSPYAKSIQDSDHCKKGPPKRRLAVASLAACGVMSVFVAGSYMVYLSEKESGAERSLWTIMSVVVTGAAFVLFVCVWNAQKHVQQIRFSFAVLLVTSLLSLALSAYEFVLNEGPQKKLWVAVCTLELVIGLLINFFASPYFENSRIISTTALYHIVMAVDKAIVILLDWPRETGTDFVTFSTFVSLIVCTGSIMILFNAPLYMAAPKRTVFASMEFDNNIDKERAQLLAKNSRKTESHLKLMVATTGTWLLLNIFIWAVALTQLRTRGEQWSFSALVVVGVIALVVTCLGVFASLFLDLHRCYSDYFMAFQILSFLTVAFETIVLLGGAGEKTVIDYATLILYNRELLIASGIPIVLVHAQFHAKVREAVEEEEPDSG